MVIHQIKIQKKYFDRIITGQKNFEVRFNDRDYQVGDQLHFFPFDEDGSSYFYEQCHYEIKYIHSGLGMLDNFIVLDIRSIT